MQVYEARDVARGIDGLELVERPIPQPGASEVLVRIRAATLNYRDLLTVKGGYGSRQKFPLIPLSDAAGTVEAVGPAVSRFKLGDRVFNSFFPNWLGGEPSEEKFAGAPGGQLDGVLTQYRVFPQYALMHPPPHLSDIEACPFRTMHCVSPMASTRTVYVFRESNVPAHYLKLHLPRQTALVRASGAPFAVFPGRYADWPSRWLDGDSDMALYRLSAERALPTGP